MILSTVVVLWKQDKYGEAAREDIEENPVGCTGEGWR